MERSSASTPQRQSLGVSREQIEAMLAVLNRRWLSMGWRAMDTKDSEPMALVWIEALNREHIPYRHYGELYRRSIKLRANRLELGLKCDDFSVEMMISCWPGLKDDLEQRRIREGRTLGANAASVCRHCLGSGFREVVIDGVQGTKRCNHED